MPTHQRTAGLSEHLQRAAHQLHQQFLNLGIKRRRHGHERGRALRRRVHGKQIAQGMGGCDPAKQPGIINERAKEIDALDQHLPGRKRNHSSIIGGVEPDQHIRVMSRFEARQYARQDVGADLRAAAPASHGKDRQRLRGLGGIESKPMSFRGVRSGHGLARHGKVREPAHETPVDPIFPLPDPLARETERPARGDGMAPTGRKQREPVALRSVGFERLTTQRPAQVVGERPPHPDRKNARFLERSPGKGHDIARGEHRRIGTRAQTALDLDESVAVEREPRVA